jgi:hypothetical protein
MAQVQASRHAERLIERPEHEREHNLEGAVEPSDGIAQSG